MSDNIFNSQSQTTDNQTTAPTNTQAPAFNDLLATIKNEKGEQKYRDINTALDALRHSQEYITQLRDEKDRLAREREELLAEKERLANIEDAVSKLTSTQNQTQQQTQTPVISEEAVSKLIQDTLTKKELAQTQQTNIKKVVDSMQGAFGGEAEKVFYEKASEIGMTVEQINSLASQAPQAVLKLFGLEQGKASTSSPRLNQTSLNTSGFTPTKTSFVTKNDKMALVGATTQDLMAEREASKNMVEELHSQGMSISDLTDPKVYFKHFS